MKLLPARFNGKYSYCVLLLLILQYKRYEKELREIEAKYAIRARWQVGSPEFKEVEVQFTQIKEFQLKQVLRVSVIKRQFLLQLKAKYAGEVTLIFLKICYFCLHLQMVRR